MNETETCSISSESTTSSAQDATTKERPPPVDTVEIQEDKKTTPGHEDDQFVLGVVADRARQARAALGLEGREPLEGAAKEPSCQKFLGEAKGNERLCENKALEYIDDNDDVKRSASAMSASDNYASLKGAYEVASEEDMCSKKCTDVAAKGKQASSEDLEKHCKSDKDLGEWEQWETSGEAKAESGGQTFSRMIATTSEERTASRPGAVHVFNPLGSTTATETPTLEHQEELCSSDDEEVCLREISAHLVNEDLSFSRETHTDDMTCSERVEDVRPGVTIVQDDNVIEGRKEDSDHRQWFLYLSLAGIIFLMIVILLLVLGLAGIFQPTEEDLGPLHMGPPPVSKLERIQEEGVLKCAYSAFARSEFDDTLCQALAAAILGDAAEIEYVNLPLMDQRFAALTNGDVDVVIRVVTHTMERDVYEATTGSAFTFSTPYMYDGMKVAGDPFFVQCAEDNMNHLGDCRDLKVCVPSGGTHYRALAAWLPERNIVPLEFLYTTRQFVLEQFSNGVCNVVAGERSDLNPHKVRESGYEGDYAITERYFTKEPLSMVTSSEDPEFADFVNAVLEALLVAEQHNITQEMATSIPKTTVFGVAHQDMFQNAIAVSGHFGEIYDRFLAEHLPRDSVNMINDGNTGLIFSHPFGVIAHDREEKPLGPFMQRILDRGFLRCGIRPGRVGFVREQSDHELAGIDSDYCCAVAAALFQGDFSKVEYVSLESGSDGYALLADGSIDIVAGATRTLESDVREPTTGMGFAFSQPYFYSPYEENLCLATRQEDKDWSSFVYWIVASTFHAEENNITRATSNSMPEVYVFGPSFHRMFRDAVLAAGSYAEIYERNLQHFIPRSGRNLLNINPNLGPQHYPLPGFFNL